MDDKKLRKADMVNRVSARTGLSKGLVKIAVDALLQEIGEALEEGVPVQFYGFGTFDVRHYPARMGVHPRTGEPMEYPEQCAPSFRSGQGLKRKVRRGSL